LFGFGRDAKNACNRLTSAGNGLATTIFGYDHNDQRVWKKTSTATTTYIGKYFEKTLTFNAPTTTATTTSYIFAQNDLVATVQGTGSATTTRYQHADQLGSINITTDHNGTLQQQLDYYPYGGARINTNAGTVNAERTYNRPLPTRVVTCCTCREFGWQIEPAKPGAGVS
jgi:hypothetical protein